MHFTFSGRENVPLLKKVFLVACALWFIIFLFIVESLTGLCISFVTLILLLISYAWKKQTRIGRVILISVALAIPLIAFNLLRNFYREYDYARLISIDMNARTEHGNAYTFNLENPETENGFPVYVYMCEDELRRSWNQKSQIGYDSVDIKQQPLKYTLMRFLASKGLRKDSAALAQLTEAEIHAIELGITNVNYQSPSFKGRLVQIIWEFNQYANGGDPNGHSLMQRIESLKAASSVIRSNLLLGVGTGDLPAEIHKQYSIINSKLDKYHYLRSHNQYLAIAVAFGIFGFLYFLFAVFYPLSYKKKDLNYFYLIFFITALLSMLTEDTLETQAGATFFAFFNAFFLFANPKETRNADKQIGKDEQPLR